MPYTLTHHELRKVSAESFVHLHGSRYSIPPDYVGQPVIVEIRQGQQRVVVRAKNVVIAEHPQATKRGESVTDKAHLDALWKLSLAHDPPPSAAWHLTFSESVAARPLSTYEAVVS